MAHLKSKDNNASKIKSKTLKIGRPWEPTETMEQDKQSSMFWPYEILKS